MLRVAMRLETLSLSRSRLFALAAAAIPSSSQWPAFAAPDTVKMDGLRGEGKSTTMFSDFERTASGLQYKEFKPGDADGASPKAGDKVLVDWTGVTVGYQGRYFQTRNKPKGGAFAGDGFDIEYLAFTVGDGTVIPAIDEAVRAMKPGGIRRLIVPEEIGYPKDGFATVGPKPTTFSGERALVSTWIQSSNIHAAYRANSRVPHAPHVM